MSFAFVKASQGQRYVDPTFIANVKGARAAGLLLGAYHFLGAWLQNLCTAAVFGKCLGLILSLG
ncbi:GH25 family lysozyme [Paenibacillus sp. ALE3]|uniref:GH25 family lysozyme n=1 Tax=unclassified Paenibacillus TaxID=185978 RepID=UPI001E2E7B48|nr:MULTISPECIES: GH25 family lysozyme [Paenibacillus]